MRMLPKYYRFHLLNKTGADLVSSALESAEVNLTLSPWKMSAGERVNGTAILEDFGLDSGNTTTTIASTASGEGAVIDNTTNKYFGAHVYFEVLHNDSLADGDIFLYMETSDNNIAWPSDQTQFDVEDLIFVGSLPFASTAENETNARNFEL